MKRRHAPINAEQSSAMLHITNGDATCLNRTPLEGEIIVWRDVLHEGPVPAGLTLEALSRARAEFIHGQGWDRDLGALIRSFEERDSALARFREHDRVLLWFEADLYDQLQILQILDWFSSKDIGTVELAMICIGEFPGVEPFWGLGQLDPEQLASLYGQEVPVTRTMLALAARAWAAFRSSDPRDIEAVLQEDTNALPFLADAFRRHLQQFPCTDSGVSRTGRYILQKLVQGPLPLGRLFNAYQHSEARPFMGDTSFLDLHVRPMAECPCPLIVPGTGTRLPVRENYPPKREDWRVQVGLTATGHAVLAGKKDNVDINGVDRWLGGVHLKGKQASWRWDASRENLAR